jgi:glutathione S-transferase
MSDEHQPILHHFEASPFSEKIRVIFGFKGIAWQSVLIPRILPKPDLMPLTGGYRRTPVLQIGAEVFCDTRAIIRELEARYPEPALFPDGNTGLPWIAGEWADRPFFLATVNLVFGSLGDKVPQSFIEDRTKLRGAPFDVKAMTAALPHHRDQVRSHLAMIEAQLVGDKVSGGRPWLLGKFSLADVSAYMNVWYIRTNLGNAADEILAEFPAVRDWEGRVRALGRGQRTDISAAQSLDTATRAKPPTASAADASDPGGRKVGDRVAVVADEAVRTEVTGEVVAVSADHIAIRRHDPVVGEVVVHFPRIGYQVVAR